MRDQADKLRQLVQETVKKNPSLEPGVPLVVVSGGKKGVGASTVAIQLARELARLGKRTVLADANPQQPDVTRQLKVNPEGSLVDILNGTRSAVEVLRPLGELIQLLPGHWTPDSPPEMGRKPMRRMLREFRSLHAQADIVIIDAGDGMSPWVQQLWKAAHQILLVTTLETSAMKESYATVKFAPWGDVDGKVRLVVNKCDESRVARQAGDRFATTCRRFLGVNVCQASAIVKKASNNNLFNARSGPSQDDADFHQSICLLSAEVLSRCLVLASHRKHSVASSAEKSLNSSNKTQTATQK